MDKNGEKHRRSYEYPGGLMHVQSVYTGAEKKKRLIEKYLLERQERCEK